MRSPLPRHDSVGWGVQDAGLRNHQSSFTVVRDMCNEQSATDLAVEHEIIFCGSQVKILRVGKCGAVGVCPDIAENIPNHIRAIVVAVERDAIGYGSDVTTICQFAVGER